MVRSMIRDFMRTLGSPMSPRRADETFVVSARGEPADDAQPPGSMDGPTDHPRLDQLIRDGHVRAAEPDPPGDLYRIAHRPKLLGVDVEELLTADRDLR